MHRLGPALVLLCVAAYGLDYRTLKPQGYVSDFAQAIDPDSKNKLEAYSAALEKSTGVQVAFVTIASLEGEPIEDFANGLYRHWGIGQKGRDEGLLLLLAIKDRQHRLEVGRGLEPIVTDGYSGSVLRAMRPALRESRYGDAIIEAAHALGQHIAQAKGVTIQPIERRSPQPSDPDEGWGKIPLPIIIFGAFLLISMLSAGRRGGGGGGRRMRGPMILPIPWGSSGYYGGSGSGGFGGYDSGGGFGGFGGGDSGGGGASSSW